MQLEVDYQQTKFFILVDPELDKALLLYWVKWQSLLLNVTSYPFLECH